MPYIEQKSLYNYDAVGRLVGMKFSEVKDSGARKEFTTGSLRDTEEGKGRYDLLPLYALHRLAVHFENGARKYGDDNWRKGQPYKRYFGSAMRHLVKWSIGYRDEDHLAAAAWNVMCLIETEYMVSQNRLPKELDNRYTGFDGLEL